MDVLVITDSEDRLIVDYGVVQQDQMASADFAVERAPPVRFISASAIQEVAMSIAVSLG